MEPFAGEEAHESSKGSHPGCRPGGDASGKIPPTDGLQRLIGHCALHGWKVQADRFDVEDNLRYLQATVLTALARPDLVPASIRFLANLVARKRLSVVCDD